MFTTRKLDILVHPSVIATHDEQKEEKVHRKLKFKWPWRINMLAKPSPPVQKKYQPPAPAPPKVFGPLDAVTEFYSDQMSRPHLRTLMTNKLLHKDRAKKIINRINYNIERTWDSIYNFYAKRLRAKRLKRLQRKLQRLERKKPKGKDLEKIEEARKEWLSKISLPKKLHAPPKIPRKCKPLEELVPYIDLLAVPKERTVVEPLELGRVHSKALLYEITPQVLKLAELPERRKRHPSQIIDPWIIKPSTLTAKCTPRLNQMAQPSLSHQEARKHEEDKFDPWAISPLALKYKPTARILELAKPKEYEF